MTREPRSEPIVTRPSTALNPAVCPSRICGKVTVGPGESSGLSLGSGEDFLGDASSRIQARRSGVVGKASRGLCAVSRRLTSSPGLPMRGGNHSSRSQGASASAPRHTGGGAGHGDSGPGLRARTALSLSPWPMLSTERQGTLAWGHSSLCFKNSSLV